MIENQCTARSPRSREASREDGRRIFLYPDPLTLARSRAEAEIRVLADRLTYSDMCRNWGRVGGMTTATRYGRRYFSLLARVRHGCEESRTALVLHVERRRDTEDE